MHELRTAVDIDAPPEVVWDALMDFDSYPDWNPFVRSLSGVPREGERLEVTLHQPGSRPMTVRPEVLEVEPERRFVWLGRTVLPHLFDAEHRFELEVREDGAVRFVQSERFAGILVPFLRRMVETRTRAGFEAMNEALKTVAEHRARA